jgi:hypothetical protein
MYLYSARMKPYRNPQMLFPWRHIWWFPCFVPPSIDEMSVTWLVMSDNMPITRIKVAKAKKISMVFSIPGNSPFSLPCAMSPSNRNGSGHLTRKDTPLHLHQCLLPNYSLEPNIYYNKYQFYVCHGLNRYRSRNI